MIFVHAKTFLKKNLKTACIRSDDELLLTSVKRDADKSHWGIAKR